MSFRYRRRDGVLFVLLLLPTRFAVNMLTYEDGERGRVMVVGDDGTRIRMYSTYHVYAILYDFRALDILLHKFEWKFIRLKIFLKCFVQVQVCQNAFRYRIMRFLPFLFLNIVNNWKRFSLRFIWFVSRRVISFIKKQYYHENRASFKPIRFPVLKCRGSVVNSGRLFLW